MHEKNLEIIVPLCNNLILASADENKCYKFWDGTSSQLDFFIWINDHEK